MGLFGNKKNTVPPQTPERTSAVDYFDPATIRTEWPRESLDAARDLEQWRQGVELYERDDYASMMRCARLLCPSLAHSLYGDGLLVGADLPETAFKVLFAALSAPPDGHTFTDDTQRLCRLALTIVREHGWQPTSLGGNGQVSGYFDPIIMDRGNHMLLGMAIAPPGSLGASLKEFFAVPPSPPEVEIAEYNQARNFMDQVHTLIDQAEHGDEASQHHVRGMSLWMHGDRESAMTELIAAAQRGSAQAMKDAGDLASELGRDAEARFWFQAAAEAGHPSGAFNMGSLALGSGDFAAAASWYQRAAEGGNPEGYAALTQMARDQNDAAGQRNWARLGAEQGQPFCMLNHGVHLASDSSDPTTLRRAQVFLEQAVDKGETEGMALLVDVMARLGQIDESRAWAARVRATGNQEWIAMLDKYGY